MTKHTRRRRRSRNTGDPPRTYFVPRGGAVAEVSVSTFEELCAVRTELELLDRVKRREATADKTRVGSRRSHFSDEVRAELRQAVEDASNPIVQEMIARVDQEFADLRKELVMSVVNEEAENIIQEAIESGAIDPVSAASVSTATTSDTAVGGAAAANVEDALAAVEASLSAVAGTVAELSAIDQTVAQVQSAKSSVSTVEPSPAAVVPESIRPSTAAATPPPSPAPATGAVSMAQARAAAESAVDQLSNLLTEQLASANPATGRTPADASSAAPSQSLPTTPMSVMAESIASTPVASASSSATSTAPVSSAPREPAPSAAATVQASSIASSTSGGSFGVFGANASTRPVSQSLNSSGIASSSDAARLTVSTIEGGIRSLADTVCQQVRGQWEQARSALSEISDASSQINQALASARHALRELERLREDARTVSESADLARREAQLFREDAKRAKERADASACAAEASANQASTEATGVRRFAAR